MPDQVVAPVSVTPETTVTTPDSAPPESVSEIDSLMAAQGISSVSEAELRGEDIKPSDGSESSEADPAENKETEVPKKEADTENADDPTKSEEAKVTEKKTANSEPETDKPPKGYVPLAAIHEARGEIRSLKEQLQSVQSQLSERAKQVTTTGQEKIADDFEVLSDEQFEELADDNPAQAVIYQRKLAAYEAQQRNAAEQAKQEAEFVRAYDSVIDLSVEAMEKVAPGIFDPDQPVQKELMEFADSIGFTEDLYYLTNPATKIILPGETEPLLLGEQAASILGMLVDVKAKTAPKDTTALETKLRTEITAELMKKFRTADPDTYRSLNQVPKSDLEIPADTTKGKVLTTDQYAKLTPAEQERYLAGN